MHFEVVVAVVVVERISCNICFHLILYKTERKTVLFSRQNKVIVTKDKTRHKFLWSSRCTLYMQSFHKRIKNRQNEIELKKKNPLIIIVMIII